MNITLSRATRALALTGAVALAATLSACSGDAPLSAEEFCSQANKLYAGSALEGADPTEDAVAFVDRFVSLNEDIQKISAPEEIAADWKEFQKAVGQSADIVKGLDASDPTTFVDGLSALGDVEPSQESQDNLDEFFDTRCGS